MSEQSRLVLEIDSKGVVTANGNLDLFKKKSDEAAKAATGVETANKKNAKSFDVVNDIMNVQTLAMGAANLAIVKFMNSCAETGGVMEMLKTNLQVVTGSAKEADTIFRGLQTFAAETPFGIQGITDTAIQLMQVGVAADELQDQLRMLGDVSGGSQEKLNRIMVNYTQILSVGKASTMDIRQFAQANLPIYAELERVTGKTGEALQDMISNGKITGDVITQAFRNMTAEGGKFFNGMSLAADTWQGKKSTMEDSLDNLAAKFSDLWLLDFQKNAFDAITAVSDELAKFLSDIKFGKTAFDMFNEDYSSTSFDQREYVANEQIKYYSNRLNTLKNSYNGTGLDYKKDSEYKEITTQLYAWYDYLDKITSEEATAIRQQREAESAASAAAEAGRKAAESAAVWQNVLKAALNLEEVTTGNKAVSDYIENIETEMNGAIAFAQMFGEDVTKIYDEYGDRIKKAIQTLLKSGLWTPDEKTITSLSSYYNSLTEGGSGDKSAYGKMKGDLEKQLELYQLGNKEREKAQLIQQGLNSSEAEEIVTLQRKLELLKNVKDFSVEIQQSLDDQDWSEYAKYYGAQAGLSAMGGTDAGNFAQGFMQGGWQNGLINMVVGAFTKILDDSEGFQRALNLVTEALAPAGELIGSVMDALEPLMDAAVIGGEIGQSLAEVTLMIEPIMPVIKIISSVIYYISKVLQLGMNAVEKAFGWLFGDITDGMNDFADAMYESTQSAEEQADATNDLINELRALREQLREDQLYFASQNMHLNAAQNAASVNDAIIAPGGKIITTAPDDYLIATKTPGSIGSGNRVTITVINTAGDVAQAEAVSTERSDGITEIMVMVDKRVSNGIANGTYDTALESRERRIAGKRVSA